MTLYGGIDLHANNSMITILDDQDQMVYQKRLANQLDVILGHLAPYQGEIAGLVVESTYNWYWLVDGLMDAGYTVHLANTSAIKQYEGLKYSDDQWDSRWLAHLLRLGVLPEGYIYPKDERPVRDLLRKRSQLVSQKTSNLLSIQTLAARNTGHTWSGNRIQQLTCEEVARLITDEHLALAITSNLVILQCLTAQIGKLEKVIKAQVKLKPAFKPLLTVSGIGNILGLTIMLETGDIGRFPSVGDFASYCRCVGSERFSNGKRKGRGNTKNGNKYLSWAFVEAANFAVRYNPQIKRYYQRKMAKTDNIVATKAVAHKLARACFYILRDHVPFDVKRAFG